MLSQAVRTVIVSNADLVVLHAMLDKLRTGQALTAAETGVSDEASIASLDLIVPIPPILFDGTYYTQVFYIAGG